MIAVYIGALLAEIFGLALAAHGFRRTWFAFRSPGDKFIGPLISPLRSRGRVLYVRLRKMLGRPLPPRSVTLNVAEEVSLAGSMHVSMTWALLPDVEKDADAFMEMLNRRLIDLNTWRWDLEDRRRKDAGAVQQKIAETLRAVDQVRDEARSQVRTITVDGLHEQVVGWFLIVFGVLAAGVADIAGAA